VLCIGRRTRKVGARIALPVAVTEEALLVRTLWWEPARTRLMMLQTRPNRWERQMEAVLVTTELRWERQMEAVLVLAATEVRWERGRPGRR
jgi:hypothetical protein